MKEEKNFLIGCGYHPSHLVLDQTHEHLSLPHNVHFVELGLAEFTQNCNTSIYEGCEISLHLSRTPICEDELTQNEFIRFLKKNIFSNINKIVSIGLHLTGSRKEGIGKLGFSSHFKFSDENETSAIRFISNLKKVLTLPVWLENANFYSTSPQEVVQNWRSVRKILNEADAQLIFDLTHSYIEAHNLGLNPEFIFGLVPWEKVVEIHVSGYIIGSDGALHDGHSQPVNQNIWVLLNFIMERFVISKKVIINIEHTDLIWKGKKVDYAQDFKILNDFVFSSGKISHFNEKQIDYAISNINRILIFRHPEIKQLLLENGLDQRMVLSQWIYEFMQGQLRLVFSKKELPETEFENTVTIVEGFLDYIRKKLV